MSSAIASSVAAYGIGGLAAGVKEPRIALAGLARTGKDATAEGVLDLGYRRYNFGDIIKDRAQYLGAKEIERTIDWVARNEGYQPEITEKIIAGWGAIRGGISPFTECDEEKAKIRTLLERLGEAYYGDILEEYLAELPAMCVNTRLVRIQEARAWTARGGIILCVYRPGTKPASDWEKDALNVLIHSSGMVKGYIINDGWIGQAQRALVAVAHGDFGLVAPEPPIDLINTLA